MCVDNDDYDYDYDGDGDGSYSDLPPLFLVLLYGSDWRASNVLWIQSVYVDKAHRRKGYFRMLYEAAKRHAEQVGAAGFFFLRKKEKEEEEARLSLLLLYFYPSPSSVWF